MRDRIMRAFVALDRFLCVIFVFLLCSCKTRFQFRLAPRLFRPLCLRPLVSASDSVACALLMLRSGAASGAIATSAAAAAA